MTAMAMETAQMGDVNAIISIPALTVRKSLVRLIVKEMGYADKECAFARMGSSELTVRLKEVQSPVQDMVSAQTELVTVTSDLLVMTVLKEKFTMGQ